MRGRIKSTRHLFDCRTQRGGYIAIMAAIVIGLFLIACISLGSVSGWYARFNVLQSEAKEQSRLLADGCADIALLSLVADSGYAGDATTSEEIGEIVGECYIFPVATSSLPGRNAEIGIRVRAHVGDAYTNMLVSARVAHVTLGAPLSHGQHDSLFPEISTVWRVEVSN